MKISIITPSYNQAEFLERCIRSVWQQAGDFDLEHIVADGGSTDGSVEILRKFEQLHRSGEFKKLCRALDFKWWSKEDRGQSDAINTGFRISTGEVLGWLNSDDTYLTPNSLSALLQPFQKVRADIVVSNGHHIDEHDTVLDLPILANSLDNAAFQNKLKTLYHYDFILQPTTLFHRRVWEACPLNEQYAYIMDWVLWIEAMEKGFRFHKINDFTATNRLHTDAKTVEGGIGKYREGLALFKRYNTWCPNRFYYYLYLFLLKGREVPLLGGFFSGLIGFAKRIRTIFINRFKVY